MINDKLVELREACEASLWIYAQTVEPHRCYGLCHKEIFEWWQQCELSGISSALCLIPRDHQKSHMIAVWCGWQIVRNPATTIVYLSATSELAERQLSDIGNILTSDIHMLLWPALINPEEGKRKQWNNNAITVDHPKRVSEGVRDPTVSTAGLTTNTTGWHCKILVKDDVVVPENAYTDDGRKKVEAKCSQMASVLTTGGLEWVVGTRYHPNDHYNTLLKMNVNTFDEDGAISGKKKLYAVWEREVETNGAFLWPRAARKSDGEMFGFDLEQLAIKKAKYTDYSQYRAQYYNDVRGGDATSINASLFMYYNRDKLQRKVGKWYLLDRELSIGLVIDFAFTVNSTSDFTSMMVIGKDYENNIYILDIVRFRTDQMEMYFSTARDLYNKWKFKKVRAEATQAQSVIVNTLSKMFEDDGYVLKFYKFTPTRNLGSKEERMRAALNPMYAERKVYHYRGGECTLLEDELKQAHPEHDDIKDTLTQGISWPDLRAPRPPVDEQEESEKTSPHKRATRFGGCR